MRNSLMLAMVILSFNRTIAQAHGGFEQYFYAPKSGPAVLVPVVYYQTEHNWYFESHINYEQVHTYSVYIGKTFSENKEFSWSFTPMLGGLLGSLKGGIFGLNAEMNYKKLHFTSQSQYIFSFEKNKADFFYSWIELGYQVIRNTLIGFSIQNTMINPVNVKLETGLFIRLNVKKWNFPVYCFNSTSENRYWILGVAREFSFPVNKINKGELVKP